MLPCKMLRASRLAHASGTRSKCANARSSCALALRSSQARILSARTAVVTSVAASAAGEQASGRGGAGASTSRSSGSGAGNSGWVRKLSTAKSAADLADLIAADRMASGSDASPVLTEEETKVVLLTCLERGREDLALQIHSEMTLARRPGSASGSEWDAGGVAWAPASLQTTVALVLGLCKGLSVLEAMKVINAIRALGMPSKAEVGFGKVITCPLAPNAPLAVVQPQEGCKVVADSFTRYEYELYSGNVVSCSSEALNFNGNPLLSVARAIGIMKKGSVGAVHEFVVRSPDGGSRTFRVGTETANVPAQVGERITVVAAPSKNVRKGGFFNASPPGTKPGECLSATNHTTGQILPLLRPPISNTQTGLPAWVLPAVVLFAGGDAASSLLDPSLPLLIAAGATSVAGTVLTGQNVLLPRLKQLPEQRVKVEAIRQKLLVSYSKLADKVSAVLQECAEDVRFLARLWQLQNKMEAVSSPTASAGASSASSLSTAAAAAQAALLASGEGALNPPSSPSSSSSSASSNASSSSSSSAAAAGYRSRIERVAAARANIEERLAARVELLDGYARVMNMIEIEVEMDLEVPAAELAGIEEQIGRLFELEDLQSDWRAQAEARDEVERLLRAP